MDFDALHEVGAAWWASLCYVDMRLGGLMNYTTVLSFFLVLFIQPICHIIILCISIMC